MTGRRQTSRVFSGHKAAAIQDSRQALEQLRLAQCRPFEPNESAVRNYLDHGFVLFRAYTAANFELPPGLEDSLSRRTDQFMDVADEYLKQRSEVVAVSIARAIIHEYSGPGGMDRGQRRAGAY